MLSLAEFDLKTGLTLQVLDPATQTLQPKTKTVEHSFLEAWLQTHQIDAELTVARFYKGVGEADRLRLEAAGKVLAFTNGQDGYFADPNTARLLAQGDAERGIAPLYAADANAAHNKVAYGSLGISDGVASTTIGSACVLVIDDERRSCGSAPLVDRAGRLIPAVEVEKLYDKMGDGTMLIPVVTMRQLLTEPERDRITAQVFAKAGIDGNLATLDQDALKLATALDKVEQQCDRWAQQTVTQFRAATPDLPGIIKGTMGTSQWCERLGVDAIISKNDIKGNDGRLSTPGIHTVEQFWLNRKSDGKYGTQRVGPQVKGCIPHATLHEFNPQIIEQATDLAIATGDSQKLLQYYVSKKERQQAIEVEAEEETDFEPSADWLSEIAAADAAGALAGFSKINYELERFVRKERVDNAIRGICVPSAMAQHHSQLQPWEVCNKDLPHGSIVAYYRSPFPNVGAAAIAINNLEVIRLQDREAFGKAGVSYLNPWTAKNIAITDFDKDANGYFVGYYATVPNLPEQIRDRLQAVTDLPANQQYEAGRSLFAELIEQARAGADPLLEPAQYPLAVEEFIERNAPDRKPLAIEKQAKIKHPWNQQNGESLSAAVWKAWEITANNPTGGVANLSMTLQSLALETQYIADDRKEALLKEISTHYTKQLQKASQGKLYIPTDEDLAAKEFPVYHLRDRMGEIAAASSQLNLLRDSAERVKFVNSTLEQVHSLLTDITEGPIAQNLQTAVDVAKSARGIDTDLQAFAQALQHKEHLFRQHQNDPTVYLNGNELPSNTEEPIGWAIDRSNQLYQDSQLLEYGNIAFRDLFPESCTSTQKQAALSIAHTYKDLTRTAQAAQERVREKSRADQQPTLLLTVPSSGSQVVIQRLCDADPSGQLPYWDVKPGQQPNWQIRLSPNEKIDWRNPEALVANLVYSGKSGESKALSLGYVAPDSVEQYQLVDRLRQSGKDLLVVNAPIVELRPPLVLQNDAEGLFAQASAYLREAIAAIPSEERAAYLSAMWRDKDAMDVAIKFFTPEIAERLQKPLPEMTIANLESSERILSGEYQVKFTEKHYLHYQTGEPGVTPAIAILDEGGAEQLLGTISARSLRLPPGTIAQANLQLDGKIVRLQVLEVLAREIPPIKLQAISQIATAPSPILPQSAPELPAAEPERYQPSRQELREWYMVVRVQGDQARMGEIKALGTTLNNLYNIEQGSPSPAWVAPNDYRHAAVSFSASDRQQMQRDILSFQSAVAKLASIEPGQARSQPQR